MMRSGISHKFCLRGATTRSSLQTLTQLGSTHHFLQPKPLFRPGPFRMPRAHYASGNKKSRRNTSGQRDKRTQKTGTKSKPNLYEVLGVNQEATDKDIRAAYLKKSREHHPDMGGDAAKMAQVTKAYSTLKDQAKRKRYDAYLETGEEPFDFGQMQFTPVRVSIEDGWVQVGNVGQFDDISARTCEILANLGASQVGQKRVPDYKNHIFWPLLAILIALQGRSMYNKWNQERAEGIPDDFVDYDRARFVGRIMSVAALATFIVVKRRKGIVNLFNYQIADWKATAFLPLAALFGPLTIFYPLRWYPLNMMVESDISTAFWDPIHNSFPQITQAIGSFVAMVWTLARVTRPGGLRTLFSTLPKVSPHFMFGSYVLGRGMGWLFGHFIYGIFTSPYEYVPDADSLAAIAVAESASKHTAQLDLIKQQLDAIKLHADTLHAEHKSEETPVNLTELLCISQSLAAVSAMCTADGEIASIDTTSTPSDS